MTSRTAVERLGGEHGSTCRRAYTLLIGTAAANLGLVVFAAVKLDK
ncbi:hypothetical protein [Nocardioides daphniae]|nr:hypothetical protein [Nocardioides daphniae]